MNTQQVSDLKLLYEAVYDENLREKVEEYNNTVYDVEAWVNQLVEEGYDLSDYTWDEMVEIYGQNEYIDEGIGSLLKTLLPKLKPALKNIGSIFKKGKLPPVKAPMSANAQRSAQLRTRYNVGPERSDTSAKRQIIDRARDNATRAQAQVDLGNASPSYSSTAKDAVDRYLKAGYSKYGAGPGSGGQGGSGARGGGNKAFNKAKELNPELTRNDYLKLFNNSYEYDMFDVILEYLVAEGYADTNESALAIMTNMSEEWRQSIVEGAVPMPSPASYTGTGRSGTTFRGKPSPMPTFRPAGTFRGKPNRGKPVLMPPVGATVNRYDSAGKPYTHIQK